MEREGEREVGWFSAKREEREELERTDAPTEIYIDRERSRDRG